MTTADFTARWSVQATARWAWRNARGAVVAAAVALRLAVSAEASAFLASPRWHVFGARAAEALASRKAAGVVAGLGAVAGLAWWLVAPVVGGVALLPVVAWLVFRRWWATYPRTLRARVRTYVADSFGVPVRRYTPDDGFADHWELDRHLSTHAAQTVAAVTRPSLTVDWPAEPGSSEGRGVVAEARARRELATRRLPPGECGTLLGPSVIGPVRGTDCYAPHRDIIGIYGAPQSGKTAWLGGRIIDHCGAVVATSTKLDLYLATAALRATGGRRVALFNPDGLGGLPSTLRWNPLDGCRDARTARLRATHHITGNTPAAGPGGGSDSEAPWEKWSTGVLAALFMTAARSGRTMADVAHWVFTQEEGAKKAAAALYEAFEGRPPQLVVDAMRQIVTTEAKKTRDSIFMILREAVSYMGDDTAAACTTPKPGEPTLDVAAFITRRDTLHVVSDKTSASGPLRAALLGHVFETARILSADYPRQRLDPPLAMALDEIALNPVPLPEWLPDAGGRGVHLWWAVQSPSQLDAVWGSNPAKVIRDCTNVLMIFGGLKDPDDLQHISDLCGSRLEMTPDPDGDGPGHARFERVPVIRPDGVRRLVELRPLVIQRNSRPTMVRVDPYWERDDVKAAGPATAPSADAAPGQTGGEVVLFPTRPKQEAIG